jgi:hypothetical protein
MMQNIPTMLAAQDFQAAHSDMLAAARGEVAAPKAEPVTVGWSKATFDTDNIVAYVSRAREATLESDVEFARCLQAALPRKPASVVIAEIRRSRGQS